MQYIDISIQTTNPSAFTKKAHGFDVNTQILLKVPREKMMTMRLKGEHHQIVEVLRALFPEPVVQMHARVIKPLVTEAPHHKNRWISEQREKALT